MICHQWKDIDEGEFTHTNQNIVTVNVTKVMDAFKETKAMKTQKCGTQG